MKKEYFGVHVPFIAHLGVEAKIIAEGEEEALEKFAKKMQRGHSLFGMFTTVDNFFVKWEEPTGEFNEFSIKDTKY